MVLGGCGWQRQVNGFIFLVFHELMFSMREAQLFPVLPVTKIRYILEEKRLLSSWEKSSYKVIIHLSVCLPVYPFYSGEDETHSLVHAREVLYH